jgi:hypothetical protein
LKASPFEAACSDGPKVIKIELGYPRRPSTGEKTGNNERSNYVEEKPQDCHTRHWAVSLTATL